MLAEVLNVLESKLNMRRGTIMLVSPEKTDLVVEAARNLTSSKQKSVRYKKGEGIVGRVMETGESEIIPCISEEPRFRNRIFRRNQDTGRDLSFLCVPISLNHQVTGTLSVDVPSAPDERLQQHTHVLEIVASMIAGDVRSRRETALQKRSYEAENLRLRNRLGEKLRPENIVGNSPRMREVYRMIHQVAPTDTTILVRGESGTGKELVASAIHYRSKRKEESLIKVNCAALSENLIESELFGHAQGAFTGATRDRRGRIAEAEKGTLFLDEIGDFSPNVQIKLLRMLQEKEYQPVGSSQTKKADVRIIAATNCDLEEAVEAGKFRKDLYYRINGLPIYLPPLRRRRDDILLLADHFVEKYAQKMGKDVSRITTEAINALMAYHWPGNVRELENCIERAVLLSEDNVIHSHHLPPTLQMPDAASAQQARTLEARVEALERDMITDALKCSSGNMAAAARQLGLSPRQIRYKIKQLDIQPERFEQPHAC
ncbi:MAG: sigma 54-interacting transcriptional regulator [Planctomycetota bacterium]